jgi:hypothetical protein
MRGGEVVQGVIAQMKSVAEAVMASNDPAFGRMGYRLNEAVEDLEQATDWMLQALQDDQDQVLAAATPYLRLFGLAAGGTNLAAGALATAKSASASGGGLDADIALARYFAENHLPDTRGLTHIVRGGGSSLLQMTPDLISA